MLTVDRLGADVVLDEDAGKKRGKIKDSDILVQAGHGRDHQAAVLFDRLDKRGLESLRILRLFGYDRRPYERGVHHGGVHEAVLFPCHAVQRHHAPPAPGREHGKALPGRRDTPSRPPSAFATTFGVADLLPVYRIKAQVRALEVGVRTRVLPQVHDHAPRRAHLWRPPVRYAPCVDTELEELCWPGHSSQPQWYGSSPALSPSSGNFSESASKSASTSGSDASRND